MSFLAPPSGLPAGVFPVLTLSGGGVFLGEKMVRGKQPGPEPIERISISIPRSVLTVVRSIHGAGYGLSTTIVQMLRSCPQYRIQKGERDARTPKRRRNTKHENPAR